MTLKPPLMSSMCEWQKALLLEIAPFVYPGDVDLKTREQFLATVAKRINDRISGRSEFPVDG